MPNAEVAATAGTAGEISVHGSGYSDIWRLLVCGWRKNVCVTPRSASSHQYTGIQGDYLP